MNLHSPFGCRRLNLCYLGAKQRTDLNLSQMSYQIKVIYCMRSVEPFQKFTTLNFINY